MSRVIFSILANNEQKYYHKPTLRQSHGVPSQATCPATTKKEFLRPTRAGLKNAI